jgi:hypothetical protein
MWERERLEAASPDYYPKSLVKVTSHETVDIQPRVRLEKKPKEDHYTKDYQNLSQQHLFKN